MSDIAIRAERLTKSYLLGGGRRYGQRHAAGAPVRAWPRRP